MYAPQAPGNLLSVKCLRKENLSVNFVKEDCRRLWKGEVVAVGKLRNELCQLQEEELLSAQSKIKIRKCSCRDVCKDCIKSKVTTKPFPKKSQALFPLSCTAAQLA